MKKKFVYIAPLVFLFFLLLPVFSAVVLQGTQWYLKAKAAERMEQEQLVTLTMPAIAVRWEKKDKELRIEGRLFDVKHYRLLKGQLTATGYFDEKEALLESLLALFPPSKKQHRSSLPFLFLWQCFTATICLLLVQNFRRGSVVLYFFYPLLLPSPLHLVLRKPPRY